jgi:translation initiation factor IF-3
MATLMVFRAVWAASPFRPATLPVIRTCRMPQLATVRVRYAANLAPMPGSNNPRNHDIPHDIVQLAGEDGRLGLPTPLSHLIASVDPKTHYVELVTAHPQPVVKIRNKREQIQKAKQWKKRQKEVAANNVQKEIQLTWGVASGDLMHKLTKARKEVEKGSRVELVFAPKVNQQAPSLAKMEALINETVEKIADFAREWMPRKVEGGIAILYLKKYDRTSKPTKPA